MQKERFSSKWRGFTKCSLDRLCDTFTAGLLTVYTEGKQLGIGVSCLCVNRCSINHVGPANKASPSWGPTLYPPARKGVGCRPAERTDTLTLKAAGLPILPSLDAQRQGWPGSLWGHLEPDNWKVKSQLPERINYSYRMFMKAFSLAICYKIGHWYLHWALEGAWAPPS